MKTNELPSRLYTNTNENIIKKEVIPFQTMIDTFLYQNPTLTQKLEELGTDLSENNQTDCTTLYVTTDMVSSKQLYNNILNVTHDAETAAKKVNQMGAFPLQIFMSCLSRCSGLNKTQIAKITKGLYFEGDGYKYAVNTISQKSAELILDLLVKINSHFNVTLRQEFTARYGTVQCKGVDTPTFTRICGTISDTVVSPVQHFVSTDLITIENGMKATTDITTDPHSQPETQYFSLSRTAGALCTFEKSDELQYVTRIDCSALITPISDSIHLDTSEFKAKIREYCATFKKLVAPQNQSNDSTDKSNMQILLDSDELSNEQKLLLAKFAIDYALQVYYLTLEVSISRSREVNKSNDHIKINFDGKRIIIFSSEPIDKHNELNDTNGDSTLVKLSQSVLSSLFDKETRNNFGINITAEDIECINTGDKALCFSYLDKHGDKIPFIVSPNPAEIYAFEKAKADAKKQLS